MFDDLKATVTSHPVLLLPDEAKQYQLEVDSSNFATRAVLSQEGTDMKWHLVVFYSKSLSEVQRNYEIHDKEMLTII